MKQDKKADLTNSDKNTQPGTKLHQFVATGGKPKDYNPTNKTKSKRASSKQRLAK